MLRFTIRDVLWLMVVVGLAVGWSLQWVQHRRELQSARKEIESARQATYDTVAATGQAAARWAIEVNRNIDVELPVANVHATAKGDIDFKYLGKYE